MVATAVEIRRAKIEDVPALEPIVREFSAYQSTRHPFDMARFTRLWEGLLTQDAGAIFLLEFDDVIVGLIGGFRYEDPCTGTIIAQELGWYVQPSHRGNGMRLYWHYEDWARKAGCEESRMAYLHDSMPEQMLALYRSIGYRPMETHVKKGALLMAGITASLILGGLAAGGAIGGSAIGARAAGKAADTQSAAADRAAALSLAQGKEAAGLIPGATAEANKLTDPYRLAGNEALDSLRALVAPGGDLNRNFTAADFQVDPGFAFRQEQGEQALNRSLAARTGVLSGHAVKEGMRFNQGLASQEYQAAFDRFSRQRADRYGYLSGVAGSGQNAAQAQANNIFGGAIQQGNFLTNAAGQAANFGTQAANAQAAGTIGGANAISGGISGGLNSLQQMYLISQLFKPEVPSQVNPQLKPPGKP